MYAVILTGGDTQEKYLFDNVFGQYYSTVILYMVWDLPVILTTLKLNYDLLVELNQDIKNHNYYRQIPGTLTSSDFKILTRTIVGSSSTLEGELVAASTYTS